MTGGGSVGSVMNKITSKEILGNVKIYQMVGGLDKIIIIASIMDITGSTVRILELYPVQSAILLFFLAYVIQIVENFKEGYFEGTIIYLLDTSDDRGGGGDIDDQLSSCMRMREYTGYIILFTRYILYYVIAKHIQGISSHFFKPFLNLCGFPIISEWSYGMLLIVGISSINAFIFFDPKESKEYIGKIKERNTHHRPSSSPKNL